VHPTEVEHRVDLPDQMIAWHHLVEIKKCRSLASASWRLSLPCGWPLPPAPLLLIAAQSIAAPSLFISVSPIPIVNCRVPTCSSIVDINHPGPERRLVEGPPLVLILGGAVPAMTVRALSKRYFLKAPLTFDEGDHLAGGRFYDCDAFSNFHVAVIF
jgi:hypothetical protein